MHEFIVEYNSSSENKNVYELTSFLGCGLLKDLYEMEKDKEQIIIPLNLYEDVFKMLKEDNFEYKTNENILRIIEGLIYFYSDRLGEFIITIKNNIYLEEKEKVDRFLEKYGVSKEDSQKDISKAKRILEEYAFRKEDTQKYISMSTIDNVEKNPSFFGNICLNKTIPVQFYNKNLDKLSWHNICQNTSIPLDFFKENYNKIDWNSMSQNSSVPFSFIEPHINTFSWFYLCQNTSIPLDFLERNIDKIKWIDLCQNPSIPEEFFERHFDQIPNDKKEYLCKNPHISKSFFLRHKEIITPIICSNPSISLQFIKDNHIKIRLYELCRNTSLTENFFEQNIEKIDWRSICTNSALSPDFFERHMDLIMREDNSKEERKSRHKVTVLSILLKNTFSIYLENTVRKRLQIISPILLDKYIQINSVIMHCLNLLYNPDDKKSLNFFSKLYLPEYIILGNNVRYCKERDKYFIMQIKHFLCTSKNITEYKNEINQICAIEEEVKQEVKQEQEIENSFTILSSPQGSALIRNIENDDILEIYTDDKVIRLVKKNDIFYDDMNEPYSMYDIMKYENRKARIIKK